MPPHLKVAKKWKWVPKWAKSLLATWKWIWTWVATTWAPKGGKEEQFADIVDKLADLLGLDADVEVGEGEMEMGGEAMDDEGGDLEGAMDAPVGDDEDMGVEVEDDELMGEEEIVQEVARRVAARLIREKKQDAMANKLAERIFRRLASK